jgi:hypothetical protein
VANAFFAREPFISPLKAKGYEVTTRLRKNQHVRYV